MDNDTILEVKNITKIYPGVVALDNVSLSFKKGEVHALIGENGAGKSTLIKTLTGAIFPTSGTIEYNGKTYSKMDSHEALELGISAIYQEFNLINHLTVAENIFYGREYSNGLFVDFKKMCQRTDELCKEMDVQINPKKKVKDVGVAYQQIIEILKAASKNSNVLIMDEPTAPLTTHETESLFKLIKKLKDKGTTIIYISHRLEEIFAVCDRLSVMRDGKFITTVNTADTSRKELVKLMVGRELGNDYPPKITPDTGEVILELKNVCTDKLKNISFALKKGEILGLGGLVGAGRTEVGMAIFGGDAISSGQIIVKGKKVKISSPGEAVKNKIALIPEDRKRHGLILNLEIRKNISFSSLNTISSGSFIKKDKEYKICESLIKDLTIKTPSMNQFAKNLSGGNQQKVVLAKWLASGADIFIFDEPTRGIDVGAKQEIYKLMRNLTESGKSIIMISSEMPELMGMSDRILVMYHGEIRAELLKNEYSQENILEIASGS